MITAAGTYGGPLVNFEYRPVFDAFFQAAERSPQMPAITHGDRTFTYGELARQSLAIAAALRNRGLRSPERVGVVVDRSIEATAAMLGVFAAGLVYVPIDIRNPIERVRHIVVTSGIRTILASTPDLVDPTSVMDVLPIAEAVTATANNSVPVAVAPDDDAYVIFTSGTTGAPKGVVGRHFQLAKQLHGWRQLGYDLPGLRGALIASYGFDSSFLEHFIPLNSGGQVFVFDPNDICDTATLAEKILQDNIAFAILSPALLEGVASYFEQAEIDVPLRYLISGGEPIPNSELRRLRSLIPRLNIRAGYGTTEATVAVTTHEFDPSDSSRFAPLGIPMPGYHVFLLDPDCKPVPFGEVGEIYISGDVLARGYDSNPHETERRFVRNPVANELLDDAHPVMYRTGDLARIDENRILRFEGRADDQVQVRGLRVELGEVEAAVEKAFGARAHCGIREEGDNSTAIVAFVVIDPDAGVADGLERLQDLLPEYMVPTYLVRVDAIPVTINDKIDKKRLPEVTEDHLVARQRVIHVADQLMTSDEAAIVDIAREVLGLTGVIAPMDRFVELGADSLRIVKLVMAVQRAFDVKLPVRQMNASTLTARSLAEYVRTAPQ
nr:non-ribosomal peptide synthetase [Rhodococcus sp. HNM0563]